MLASAIFRTAQESLSDIEPRSYVSYACIRLCATRDFLEVDGTDDDIGWNRVTAHQKDCFGLIAMRERKEMLGGTIRFENIHPPGVKILAHVPIGAALSDFTH